MGRPLYLKFAKIRREYWLFCGSGVFCVDIFNLTPGISEIRLSDVVIVAAAASGEMPERLPVKIEGATVTILDALGSIPDESSLHRGFHPLFSWGSRIESLTNSEPARLRYRTG